MKFSIPITCSCGHQLTIEASGTRPFKDAHCPHCHAPIWFVEGSGDFVSLRILQRAFTELQNEDFTLVIVLGTIAIECEMARLFIKWNTIDFRMANTSDATEAQKEGWANQWGKWTGIKLRLDKLSHLLTGTDFDSFLTQHPELLKAVQKKYPNSTSYASYASQKEFLQQEFFSRRNKIVHRGEIDFLQSEAEMCATLATCLFEILKAMDAQRYETTFSGLHKKARLP